MIFSSSRIRCRCCRVRGWRVAETVFTAQYWFAGPAGEPVIGKSATRRRPAPCRRCPVRSQPAHRLVRRALNWDLAPAEVLKLVRSDAHPVALIGAWADGSDVIGSDPVLVRSPPHSVGDVLDSSWLTGDRPRAGVAGGPGPDKEPAAGPAGPAFGGGWIGYLGFGLAGKVLPAPPAPGRPRQLPAWWFGYYDHVPRHDRAAGRWFFEALWAPDRAGALDRRFSELSRRLSTAATRPRPYSCGDFQLVPSAAEHKAAVRRATEYIRQGDIFQASICLRLEAGFDGDPLDAFCRAVTRLRPRSPHSCGCPWVPWPACRPSCSCAGRAGPCCRGRSKVRTAAQSMSIRPRSSAASWSARPRTGPRT